MGGVSSRYLQVEVGDAVPVHEPEPLQDLLQELDGFALRQVLLLGDEVEQFATADAVKQRTALL